METIGKPPKTFKPPLKSLQSPQPPPPKSPGPALGKICRPSVGRSKALPFEGLGSGFIEIRKSLGANHVWIGSFDRSVLTEFCFLT